LSQVQIYVPDRNHPAHGLIRTIVADSNDTGSDGAAPIYLDSDGSLNSEASNRTLKHSGALLAGCAAGLAVLCTPST
jgi:hypothetical protein